MLAIAGAVTGGIGTIAQASAAQQQAEAQARAQDMQAAAEERQAREREAASQRDAIERGKQADLVLSRQQAVAASSGAGATDPTVLQIMGNTAQTGAYQSAAAIYEGTAAAQSLDEKAAIDRYTAEEKRRAAPTLAAATMLSGISNFSTKLSGLKFG